MDGAGRRLVHLVRWDGGLGLAPIRIVLEHPDAPGQWVVITLPRELVGPGASGIALIMLAPNLETLVGLEEAARFGAEPSGSLDRLGLYVEVSILFSDDGGAHFDEIKAADLQTHPVALTVMGLDVAPDDIAAFFDHPTFIASDPVSGIRVIAEDGLWTKQHSANTVVGNGMLHANLTGLSVFAPYGRAPIGGEGEGEGEGPGFGCHRSASGDAGALFLGIVVALAFVATRRYVRAT